MKNTSRKPYIYKVTNLETGQYYIGSQCSGKTIGVNYFTSSTNKAFEEGFKTYREEKYKIEIIKEFDDPKKCGRVENYIIRNYMLKKDGLCLNRFYCCSGEKIFSRVGTHGWNKGIPCSEDTKQKIRKALQGRPSPNKGTHPSEETKQKLSEAKKGRPSPKKGIPLPEETKKKMSEAHKGHPTWNKGIHPSEETKQKLSEASKNRISISIEGTVFSSITEASKYYNVVVPTISYWLKTKKHNTVYVEK